MYSALYLPAVGGVAATGLHIACGMDDGDVAVFILLAACALYYISALEPDLAANIKSVILGYRDLHEIVPLDIKLP